jgi:hypothetical protein
MPLKTCLERSWVLITLNFLILMNAIERLRTLGTRCEAIGRLVKERMDGGRPLFFKEKGKVLVMAAVHGLKSRTKH